MAFTVKEIFRSFQGEGIQVGRTAVFCRFAGCNLWSGREEDRDASVCRFCDTDFQGTDGPGGGTFSAGELTRAILAAFGEHQPEELFDDPSLNAMTAANNGMIWNGMGLTVAPPAPYVIFTGGEPGLQLNAELIAHLREYRLELAVETNGTVRLPRGLDWVTVSPKAGTELVVKTGQELKLVWPQEEIDPADFVHLPFEHRVLQPVDTGDPVRNAENARLVMEYCLEHPQWRLGAQLHKLLGFV